MSGYSETKVEFMESMKPIGKKKNTGTLLLALPEIKSKEAQDTWGASRRQGGPKPTGIACKIR